MKVNNEDYESIKNNIKILVDRNGIEKVHKAYKMIVEKKLYIKDSKIYFMYYLKNLSNAFKDIKNKDLYNDKHLTTALLKIREELTLYE